VFRQQRLQLRPALEEVRARYYRELKKFIQIPERFGGLSNDASPFATIIDRAAGGFAAVYRKVSFSTSLSFFLKKFKKNLVILHRPKSCFPASAKQRCCLRTLSCWVAWTWMH
jgi:hypothetical protein